MWGTDDEGDGNIVLFHFQALSPLLFWFSPHKNAALRVGAMFWLPVSHQEAEVERDQVTCIWWVALQGLSSKFPEATSPAFLEGTEDKPWEHQAPGRGEQAQIVLSGVLMSAQPGLWERCNSGGSCYCLQGLHPWAHFLFFPFDWRKGTPGPWFLIYGWDLLSHAWWDRLSFLTQNILAFRLW